MITLNFYLPSSERISEFFVPDQKAANAYEFVKKMR